MDCMSLLFVCAVSRFGNPRSFLTKVLIVAVRNCHCGELNRGLRNLGTPCEGERVVTFCVVQKVTKKHALGRAKSCRWQVFVRRRPPKQGELRTDVSKATMWGETGRRKSPRSGKGFNWLPQKCIFGALIRGLQNLESPCKGGLFCHTFCA